MENKICDNYSNSDPIKIVRFIYCGRHLKWIDYEYDSNCSECENENKFDIKFNNEFDNLKT